MSEQQGESMSDAELRNRWLNRARGMMINYYAADETVPIYGFHLSRVEGADSLWDVFIKSEDGDDYHHWDTMDLDKYRTASDIVNQIGVYYDEAEQVTEAESTEEIDDPEPKRSVH